MGRSNLVFENDWNLVENSYDLEYEAKNAALLTTGNGYMGVRGSFEEFGSIRVQGCYIRGLIDRVYDVSQPIPDNIYMKKYYFDEEKHKNAEKIDCVINFADILLIRIKIGEETFYPWEGRLFSWKRTLDMKNACLIREVRWESSRGDITYLKFERFASFENDHEYCQKVTIIPENHNKEIEILSGLDLRTKTNGQKVTKSISLEIFGNRLFYSNYSGDEYKFIYFTGVTNKIYCGGEELNCEWQEQNGAGLLANRIKFNSVKGKEYCLEKKIYVITSRDTREDLRAIVESNVKRLENLRYDELFKRHSKCWNDYFKKIDVKIKGDEFADTSLRFSNYHSAISVSRNDPIHSVGAKGLTGEQYNNFVWWDCEVYQLPIFLHTVPEVARLAMIYRYNKLDAARQLAKTEGYKGARFPFTSSVTGLETIFEYVRHPHMQIHIVADVAWGVINYYICTGDIGFLLDYGLEIIWEVARYWASRVEYNASENRYEIKRVTGTDEHHPYVDNNAYTNYLVCLVLKYAVRFYEELAIKAEGVIKKIDLQKSEIEIWKEIISKLYLPLEKDTGMIPQFDGYFSLNKSLEIAGGSVAKSYQMKESGLYHESQVIKQPDVMLLFSYINLKFDERIYKRNWNYYEARCEASSSLSYPVHSICASDMGQPESAYNYFLKSARIDLDDVHNCAWQGVHSACAAGAWLAVARGVAGIIMRENKIEVNPNIIPWWEEVQFSIVWHGQIIRVSLNNKTITLESDEANTSNVPVEHRGTMYDLSIGEMLAFDISVNQDRESIFKVK